MPVSKSVLDPVSVRVLDLLQENAEVSISDLAEATGLSASPCWRRVNEFKEGGVIKGTVALVDAPALGLTVNVFVQVSLKQQDRQSLDIFDAAIRTKPEIVEYYLLTGEADYMLRVVAEDLPKFQGSWSIPDPDPKRRQHQIQLRAGPDQIYYGTAERPSQGKEIAPGGIACVLWSFNSLLAPSSAGSVAICLRDIRDDGDGQST